jgi:hypothetical protein
MKGTHPSSSKPLPKIPDPVVSQFPGFEMNEAKKSFIPTTLVRGSEQRLLSYSFYLGNNKNQDPEALCELTR